jgi:insecticidal toxin complex protein TccC
LQKLSYRYDPAGNITEITDAALPIQHFANQRIEPVRCFTYDTLYQLISATGWESARPSLGPTLPEWQAFGPPDGSRWCNYSETYQYDEAGNLLQRIHQGAVGDTLSMRVAALSNRSVKVHSTQSGVDESFDARGNLLELQPGQGLQWNGRNQLARVTQVRRPDDADDLERYVYDSEGTRLRKIRTSAAKSIVHTAEVRYLPGLELHSNSATGEQLQVVSIQAGRCTVRLLHWDSPPPAEMDNDQLRFCFDDHLGSSAFEVDAQAQVISQEVYYPFGGTAWLAGRHEVESGYKTIRYSGKERDATGLYYYGARYYAPWLQRWLNPDPAGDVDGLGFYRFVRSNPIAFFDVQGLSPTSNSNFSLADVHSAIEGAEKILQLAVDELEFGVYWPRLLKSHVGTYSSRDVYYLSDGYREILSDIEHIKKNPSRISLESGSGFYAYVTVGDKNRTLFIGDIFSNLAMEEQSFVLIHELTHISEQFRSEDFWYVSTEQELTRDEVAFFSEYSIRNKLIEGFVDPNGREAFISRAQQVNLTDAVSEFHKSEELRTYYSFHNADTLSNIAVALSRLRKGHNA